jgi:CheY-like chemotaxis protein
MSPDVAARVFEPFFTTKSASRGTGLGLATVYGIVTQLGGTISLESALGTGTTFTICLPRTSAPSESSGVAGTGVGTPARRATILLVEDESGVRHAVARALRRLGHIVHEAGDGNEGIAIGRVHGTKLDLLISDVVMPGRNGFEIAAELQREIPGLRVLLMSGYSADVRAEVASDLSRFPLIEKPFSLQTLTERVEQLLDDEGIPSGR